MLFTLGAAFEFWLKSESGKAAMRPIAARMDKSRIWREFNKPLIANSETVTITVLMLMTVAIMAVMLAAEEASYMDLTI